MKHTSVKIGIKVAGTLTGLLGLCVLCYVPFAVHAIITKGSAWMLLLIVLPLALAAYFFYVAYLVWSRFSPLAVRHACGVLAVCVLVPVQELIDKGLHEYEPWGLFAYLGCLLAVYIAYSVASDRLSRLLFSVSAPARSS